MYLDCSFIPVHVFLYVHAFVLKDRNVISRYEIIKFARLDLTWSSWSLSFRSCGGTTTACTWNRSWSVTATITPCAPLTTRATVCKAPRLKTSWTSCPCAPVYLRFHLRSPPGWCASKWSTESFSWPDTADAARFYFSSNGFNQIHTSL